MASIRRLESKETLFMVFRYLGVRLREYTELADTPLTASACKKRWTRSKPKSLSETSTTKRLSVSRFRAAQAAVAQTPNFREFANQWYGETEITWRRSYKITQSGALDKYILPSLGDKQLGMVTKADVLAFRADLSKLKGRGKTSPIRRGASAPS